MHLFNCSEIGTKEDKKSTVPYWAPLGHAQHQKGASLVWFLPVY